MPIPSTASGFTCPNCKVPVEFTEHLLIAYAGRDTPWTYKCPCLAKFQISKARVDYIKQGHDLPRLPGWGELEHSFEPDPHRHKLYEESKKCSVKNHSLPPLPLQALALPVLPAILPELPRHDTATTTQGA